MYDDNLVYDNLKIVDISYIKSILESFGIHQALMEQDQFTVRILIPKGKGSLEMLSKIYAIRPLGVNMDIVEMNILELMHMAEQEGVL